MGGSKLHDAGDIDHLVYVLNRVSGRKKKKKTLPRGRSSCLVQNLNNCQNKFAQGGGRKNMTCTRVCFFYDFSQQASSFMRTTAVCTTTIRRDLLLQLLNPYHTIEVACPLFCVLRDEHLAIHRPVNFRLACCWHRLLYTADLLAATSEPYVYWLEEVVPPVVQRFVQWTSASCIFSAITDLLAVVQREVARLLVPTLKSMHAPPLPACLLRFRRLQLLGRRQGIATRR